MASYVFVWSKNRADIRDGNEYKIRKWLVLEFHGSGHLQIILHLNKITECLKMTTFKIVFTFDVFFKCCNHMHCKVTCILYKKQAHFSQLFLFTSTISDPMTGRAGVWEADDMVQFYTALLDFFSSFYKWSKFLALQKVWFSR